MDHHGHPGIGDRANRRKDLPIEIAVPDVQIADPGRQMPFQHPTEVAGQATLNGLGAGMALTSLPRPVKFQGQS
ncbi:hypothetical protein JQU17_19575 [Ponticoccus sp. SC2-23]|nr:hypothetical protein [Ponticoccus sp. SC6-49]MBM1244781.1 hypothetical protein [Ponticoccus sp. SC2-64]MBM1252322.1 hypothetical protein [Ponticoccus sp. SC6-33]MBM1267400.1 hypothetical protein [Ponticoccus sp. SC2-67]MBM1272025.1 hypothetical protein [Ponticoccus sp. SC2-37]MBM1283864.1 hypothetical protein [Ponticoccus sp. SC6-8]MBM1307882.1 hypothetical protein [Ponticoccus sp. SC2-23]MBM1344329.1 hypothetical protein [Ponticoccus sp. SC2-56]MBM1368368.1 hypothetical protein [Pontico